MPEDVSAARDTEGPKKSPKPPVDPLCCPGAQSGDSAQSATWPGGRQGSQNTVSRRGLLFQLLPPDPPLSRSEQMGNENRALPAGFLLPQGDPRPPPPLAAQPGQGLARWSPARVMPHSRGHLAFLETFWGFTTGGGVPTDDAEHPMRHRAAPTPMIPPAGGSSAGRQMRGGFGIVLRCPLHEEAARCS